MFDILQVKHHKAMWCNGCKFQIKVLDDMKKTCDSGITAVFQVIMFHLEATYIQKSQKIDTIGFWMIYLSMNLSPSD